MPVVANDALLRVEEIEPAAVGADPQPAAAGVAQGGDVIRYSWRK